MIKWITDEIGTGPYKEIDKIDAEVIDVRDLVDKRGNSGDLINKIIDAAIAYLELKKKIIICCDYGMSRSNAIAIGVISKWHKIPFNEAIRQVVKATNETQIKIQVINVVRNTIENNNSKKIKKNRIDKILVTGGTGYIGSNLTTQLKGKYKIFDPSSQEIDIINDLVELDLKVKEEQIDCLIHLANPRIVNTNNSIGESMVMMKNMLDVCVENNCWLVYLSSMDIYGSYKNNDLMVKENRTPFPNGINGETKFLCESLINHYRKKFNLRTTVIRIKNIYGPNSKKPRFLYDFIHKAKKNLPITVHKYINGYPEIDLLNINDLISCILSVLKKRYQGELNIGSGQLVTTKDLASLIINQLDSKSKIGIHHIHDKNENFGIDMAKVLKEIQWKPKVSLSKGLNDLILPYTNN